MYSKSITPLKHTGVNFSCNLEFLSMNSCISSILTTVAASLIESIRVHRTMNWSMIEENSRNHWYFIIDQVQSGLFEF